MLQILLGQIPEAIYFSLFMIFVKDLKEKRLLFILLMIIEYLLLIKLFPFNIIFQISYTFMSFLILKVLYKEKAQIIDIFSFVISIFIMMIITVPLYFIIWKTINNFIVYTIIDRIMLFSFLLIFNKKLNKIQKIYKIFWNRRDNEKKAIKSTTFRAMNVVFFNTMFFVLNILIIYLLNFLM